MEGLPQTWPPTAPPASRLSQQPKPSSHLEASPTPQALTGRVLGKGGVPAQFVLSKEVLTGLAHCLRPAQAWVTLTGEQAAGPKLIGYGGAAFLLERLRKAGKPLSGRGCGRLSLAFLPPRCKAAGVCVLTPLLAGFGRHSLRSGTD